MRINLKKGFTLIELIVSIAIITSLLSVVIFSYKDSSARLSLSAAAQEIAIAVRQAQVYGLSVKGALTASTPADFAYGYGAYFNPVTSPSDYYIYVDKDSPTGNGTYDVGSGCGSGSTECVEKFSLRDGIRITKVCKTVSGTETCATTGSTSLDVKFKRPDSGAQIRASLGGVVTSGLSKARIELSNPSGNSTISVVMESTGQISVQ